MNYKTLTKDDELMVGDESCRLTSKQSDWLEIRHPNTWNEEFLSGCWEFRRPIPEGWIPISEARKYTTKYQTVALTNRPNRVDKNASFLHTGYFGEGYSLSDDEATHFQVLSSTIFKPKQSGFEEAYQRLGKKHEPRLEGPMKDFLRELWEEARK